MYTSLASIPTEIDHLDFLRKKQLLPSVIVNAITGKSKVMLLSKHPQENQSACCLPDKTAFKKRGLCKLIAVQHPVLNQDAKFPKGHCFVL